MHGFKKCRKKQKWLPWRKSYGMSLYLSCCFSFCLFLSVFSLSLDSVGTTSTVCKHILDFALMCLYHNFFLQKWPLFSFVHVITVQHRIDWERRTIIRIFSKHISCADYWSPTSPATAVSWIIPASFLYLMPLMRPAVRKAQFASLFAL